ncbi:hypothetical protein EE612_005874 [Oryza sativa]|uniref:Cyanobacterial aminoacyl-tRNA synthetase CAAD domain-containing protein n=5 Tax=Oryza TaxID=4527 RepID=A0A0E0FTG4_ORYNI|nr:protein CURVATURE THYLAKOID 1C, chloroplastic-like [Oryza glaberrima]EEC71523.1 hypothetical protein OsI_03824 [Oryza sativa Indica Group]KAB8083616.1 hypothetical protein EE612_005874 [Oryza sativa]
MASALAVARPAALVPRGGSESITGNLPMLPAVPSTRFVSGRMRSRNVVAAKAAQDSSEPSSGSVVKYVQSSFSTPEDLFALAGIGFAGIAALWASINLVEVIDKLPVLPLLFELIGILVAWLFIYQNLLFKPDREKFLNNIKSSVSRVLGQ